MKRTFLVTTTSLALFAVASIASAQHWTNTANGKGSLRMDRDSRNVKKVTYDFEDSRPGNIHIESDRGSFTLHPDRVQIQNNRATLRFDSDDYRGTGHAEFRNGQMIRISLDLNGNRGALNLNFDCDDNNRGLDDQDRTGWGTRPAQGNDRNWDRQDDNQSWSNREDRDDRFGNGWHNWDSNTWDRNGNALTNWSGVREGRGPLRWQGHGSTNIQRVRVAAQRDGDTRITFIGPRTAVFTGRSYRRGDFVYVDLKTGFGQRVDGTAKISLSRRFGEFFKVTIEGRDRSGRLFEGTFDDWN